MIITVDEVTKQFRNGPRALDGLTPAIPAGDRRRAPAQGCHHAAGKLAVDYAR